MSKLRVFYTPTQANRLVVSKLKRLVSFTKFSFVELPENQIERIAFLKGISENKRAAFMWGDGNAHHESHYFTRGANIVFKINPDDHDDGYPHVDLSLVPEQDRDFRIALQNWALEGWECARITEVLWNNHMKATFEQGKDTMTEINTKERLERAVRFALEYPDLSGAATIDTDGLICFPCEGKWTTETGLLPSQLITAIGSIASKLIRLDIGGLVERINDFDLVDVSLATPPTLNESKAFALIASGGSVPGFKITKDRVNYVGSYVVFTHVGLLDAFSNS